MYKTKPINFFTPIAFVWNPERKWQTLSNIVEDYFCWTGKKLMFVQTIRNKNKNEQIAAPLMYRKTSPLKLKAITRSHFNFREFSK